MSSVALDSSGNIFAGASRTGGGLFVSSDDGASWRPSNAGMYTLTVGALAAAGTTIYAGAENLLRSGDDGASWMQVTPLSSISSVSSIAVRGTMVVVGTSYGGTVYVSNDSGNTFQRSGAGIAAAVNVEIVGAVILCATEQGIYRSVDCGATFTRVSGINANQANITLHCDGVSTCYANASTTVLDGGALLKSTDAGATWAPLGMPNTRVVAVSDSGVAYVNNGTSGALVRSDDGGASWIPVSWPPSSCGIPFTTHGDEVFAPCEDGVYLSRDKATTWSAATGSTKGAISGYTDGLVVDRSPTASGTDGDIYMDAAAGLLRSSDDGANWHIVFPSAEPYYIPYGCVITGHGAVECLGGEGDALWRSPDHGATWTTVQVNPPNTPGPMRIQGEVIGNAGSVVYAGGSLGLARSDDDGQTFQLLPGSPSAPTLQVLQHSGHVLVQSTSGTFRSSDKGVSWQPLTFFPMPVFEQASGRLLYIEVGGSARYSDDEGDTWTYFPTNSLSGSGGKMGADGTGRLVLIIAAAINPFTNLGRPAVTYTSTDGGANWEVMNPQIPNPNLANFAVDTRGRLLAATAGGLYRLDASGTGAISP